MAIVTLIRENKKLSERNAVAAYLAASGVRYEYWTAEHPVEPNSPAEISRKFIRPRCCLTVLCVSRAVEAQLPRRTAELNLPLRPKASREAC